MLMRCAGLLAAPGGMMAGAAMMGGVALGFGLGAATVGGALLAKRLYEERRGWREGASSVDPVSDVGGATGADAPVI